jgi:carbon storage regulator
MLILSRRLNQTVRIGDEITLKVIAVEGNHVRIGIAAPRDVSVDREEIWLRKRRERPSTGGPFPATPEIA